jgi:hypothetical protein
VLEALHGHGVQDPIRCLQFRRPYRAAGWLADSGEPPKYFRCDLFLDFGRLTPKDRKKLDPRDSDQNWIEIDLIQSHAPANQSNRKLLRDLVRLMLLVPLRPTSQVKPAPSVGRFLLHVYQHPAGVVKFDPKKYLSLTRQTGEARSQAREWLHSLLWGSATGINWGLIPEDRKTLAARDAQAGEVNFDFEASAATCSTTGNDAPAGHYTCVLSQIKSFGAKCRENQLKVSSTGKVIQKPDREAVRKEIQERVARWIRIKSKSEMHPPLGGELR